MAITKAQITKWNNTFKAATKAEKRVMIAKDVIAQLKAKKYIANTRSYIKYTGIDYSCDVQSNFDKINRCRVCALGGILLSTTKYKNKLKANNVNYITSTDTSWNLLKGIFDPKQILLIETAFEENYIAGSKVGRNKFFASLTEKEQNKAIEFAPHLTNEKKLIAICRNIIENKGTFKP